MCSEHHLILHNIYSHSLEAHFLFDCAESGSHGLVSSSQCVPAVLRLKPCFLTQTQTYHHLPQ